MQNNIKTGWKRNFLIIWIGQAFSLLGSELVQFTLVWYLTKTTGSPSVLALASFVALIPSVILGPFTGALVDRLNRKRVMILADASIAAFTMILAVVFYLGRVQVWHIYAIMFMRSLGRGFHWPAMEASTSLLVPKGQLSRISGLNQTLHGALGILSPIFAALLLEYLPMSSILSIDVLTAFLAIAALLLVEIPQPPRLTVEDPQKPAHILADVKYGFHYLTKWKGMFYMAVGAALLNFLLSPGYTFTPLLVTEYFGKGALELSLIESAFSVGMILGGISLSIWGGFRKSIVTILAGLLGLGGSTLLIALAPADKFSLAVFGMALTGFMMPITNGPLFAIMQANVEPEVQGRVFSMMQSMSSAMMPIGMLIAAPVAELIGIRGWLLFGASGCLAMGVAGFFIPELLNVEEESAEKRKILLEQKNL